jgi:hypothetical protein
MAVEHAPSGKCGFFGAPPQIGTSVGTGLATITLYLASM